MKSRDLFVSGGNVTIRPSLQCCLLSLCQDTQMCYQSCQFSMTTLIPYLRTQTFPQESILQIIIYQVRRPLDPQGSETTTDGLSVGS